MAKERTMLVAGIIVVLGLMLVLFFAVTIAGGRAHDRANAEAARKVEARRLADLQPAVNKKDQAS
jgi:hypothetical protein